MMNCKQIIENYLADNGFDGLQNGGECGCEISDLFPCGEDPTHCTPGYKWPGDNYFDFIIRPVNPLRMEK